MSDGLSLYLVIIVLYGLDCLIWLSKYAVAFTVDLFGNWRAGVASSYLSTGNGGLTLLNLIPPAGRVFCSHPVPFSISNRSVVSCNPQALVSMSPSPLHYLIEDITDISIDEKTVSINGLKFCVFNCAEQAKKFLLLLKKIKKAKLEKRDEYIRCYFAEMFDTAKAKNVLTEFSKRSRLLRTLSFLLFIILVPVSPVLSRFIGLDMTIIITLIVTYVLVILISILFFRLHQRYYPQNKYERILEIVKMILCPPIAARAADRISQNALWEYHFFSIGSLLMRKDRFEVFCHNSYRAMMYPLRDTQFSDQIQAVLDDQSSLLMGMTTDFLKSVDIDVNQLLKPPKKQEETSLYYCPRCHAESDRKEAHCVDCLGVALVEFEKLHM